MALKEAGIPLWGGALNFQDRTTHDGSTFGRVHAGASASGNGAAGNEPKRRGVPYGREVASFEATSHIPFASPEEALWNWWLCHEVE